MSTINTRAWQLAFSLNRQSVLGTAIADGQLNKMRPTRNFVPIIEEIPAKISDSEWYGKGHTWATFADRVQTRLKINSQERSATSLELLYAAAMVMGNVVSVQPGSGSSANEWRHTVTFQDVITQKYVIPTTMMQKMGTEFQEKIPGCWINSFTIRGVMEDHVQLAFEGGARGPRVASVAAFPAMSTASFYKTLYGRAYAGPVLGGAPAEISASVLSFELTATQNAQPIPLMGNPAGEEMLTTEVLIGKQAVSGNIVVKVDNAMRGWFTNQNQIAFKLALISPDVIDNSKHQCWIDIPVVILDQESMGEQGSTTTYTLNIDPNGVLKIGNGATDPFKMTFITNISNTELLVNA